jgi:hypothetical protein
LRAAIDVMKLIDGYLVNMKKSSRESIVGKVDQMTRKFLSGEAGQLKNDLSLFF